MAEDDMRVATNELLGETYLLSQEEDCRHHTRPQLGSRAETNSRGKELKFQRRKPSAGIFSLESRGLHVFFVFSKATEVEQ